MTLAKSVKPGGLFFCAKGVMRSIEPLLVVASCGSDPLALMDAWLPLALDVGRG